MNAYEKWEILIELHPYLAFVVLFAVAFIVSWLNKLIVLGGKHARRKLRKSH